MTETKQIEVRNALNAKGWFLQTQEPTINGTKFANLFCQNWLQDDIKEYPNGKRLRETCNAIDLHTDPATVRFIIMECKQAATIGGEVILLNADTLMESLSPKAIALLKDVESYSPSPWKKGNPACPVFSTTKKGELQQCYYAPWYLMEPQLPQLKQVFREFLAAINHSTPIELSMNKGDVLIVDNHRMLHGRRAFLRNSGRWFNRFWIPGTEANILFDKRV